MTYYYALYEEYYGINTIHKARTLKNALAGLRKLLTQNAMGDGVGFITTSEMTNGTQLSPRSYPKGYVGTMNTRIGKRKLTVTFNGRKIQTPADDYVWFGKGKRKGQLVMADGSLRPYERK